MIRGGGIKLLLSLHVPLIYILNAAPEEKELLKQLAVKLEKIAENNTLKIYLTNAVIHPQIVNLLYTIRYGFLGLKKSQPRKHLLLQQQPPTIRNNGQQARRIHAHATQRRKIQALHKIQKLLQASQRHRKRKQKDNNKTIKNKVKKSTNDREKPTKKLK